MIAAQGARRTWMVGLLVFLGLGLSLYPTRLMASHGVFHHLDAADRQLAARTLQETLEGRRSGEVRPWRNDLSGNSGTFMPLRTFKIETGHFCRDYRETAITDFSIASRDLTGCRSRDGVWTTIGE